MFEKLLNNATVNIATIRALIKRNDKLREITFGRDNEIVKQLKDSGQFMELFAEVPTRKDWSIYEHCSVVTRLYAIYESFVEDLIKNWLEVLPNLTPRYSDLEKQIRNTHREGVGRLLRELNKKKFKHLSPETVVRGFFDGLTANENYELIPEAFLFHEQNLRINILEKLLADSGISDNSWNWVVRHRDVKKFVEEIIGDRNNAEKELEQLIDYRNEAAHGLLDTFLGTQELLDLTYFIESLCQALAELVTYRIISLQTSAGEAREIGKITEWFKKPRAAVAIINDISLSVGDSLFLVSEESSYCRLATIESMEISDRPQQQLQITAATEVGFKFDIDAKKALTVIAPPNSLN